MKAAVTMVVWFGAATIALGAIPRVFARSEMASDPDCGTVVMNSDGTYETAYTWSYGGLAEPYYGAFAECYDGPAQVCAFVGDLTDLGHMAPVRMDIYVWQDAGGVPGAVVATRSEIEFSFAGVWPAVARNVFQLEQPVCVGPKYWIGCCATPSAGDVFYWVAADLDGPGGCPMTNIAPGLGYPSGWQDPGIVWLPTAAMGVGAQVVNCPPTPTQDTSWGRVKALMR